MKTEEFGKFNGFNYRVCYGLKDGKMNYSVPLYEFHKTCQCDLCKRRAVERKATNNLCATADSKEMFAELTDYLNGWQCDKQAVESSAFATTYVKFYDPK